MYSTLLFSIVYAAALASAAPSTADKRAVECPGSGAYYVCAKSGFRGYCSSDPCDKSWCPDFTPYTCDRKPNSVECLGDSSSYYVCANGFRGKCSTNACVGSWCPDFEQGTCAKKTASVPVTSPWTPGATECPGSGAYYVCAKNGFKGYCSSDPCAKDWCPDFAPKTCSKVKKPDPAPVPVPETKTNPKAYYVCASNSFRGDCSVDPCALPWCPDYKLYSHEPIVRARAADDTVCTPGTGFFQVCGGNGFHGCCKSDACGSAWCADYEAGTYTPKHSWAPIPVPTATPTPTPTSAAVPTPPVAKEEAPTLSGWTDPTVCAAGKGYYQVCGASGFKGCCKQDACAMGYCPRF
jgi:hypothetical protein